MGHLAIAVLVTLGVAQDFNFGKYNSDFCAQKCQQLGFCCNDFFAGSNQYLSCSQACMVRVRRTPRMECEKMCTEERKCRYTSRGFVYHTCSSCDDIDNHETCLHGVRNASACMAGCALFDGADSDIGHVTYDTDQLRSELRRVLTRDYDGSCLNLRFFAADQLVNFADILSVDREKVHGEHIKRTLLRRIYEQYGDHHCLKDFTSFSPAIVEELAYLWLEGEERPSSSLSSVQRILTAVLRDSVASTRLNMEQFSATDRVLLAESVSRKFHHTEGIVMNAENVIDRLKEKYGQQRNGEFEIHEGDLSNFDATALLLMYDLVGDDEVAKRGCSWENNIVTDQPSILKCKNGIYCNYIAPWDEEYACCAEHAIRGQMCAMNTNENDELCSEDSYGLSAIDNSTCNEDCSCGGIWDPVCSTTTTFSSACEARCADVADFVPGACGCECTDTWDPVCGKNGQTYSNTCKADCAGIQFSRGACGSVTQRCEFNPGNLHSAECDYDGCRGWEFWGCDQDGSCIQGKMDARCASVGSGLPSDDPGWCYNGRRDQWCPVKDTRKRNETVAIADVRDSNDRFGLTVFGCPGSFPDIDAQWHPVQRKYGARCCVDSSATAAPACVSSSCLKNDGCACDQTLDGSKTCDHDCDSCGKYWYTYAEALQRCSDIGAQLDTPLHLCTREEVESDLCCETGCQHDSSRVWILPNLTVTSESPPVTWFNDGDGKNYEWMQESCQAKNLRLCSYDELCPREGAYPVGWPGITNQSWVPIDDEELGGQRWVQVGTEEICSIEPCSPCCGDWCHNLKQYPWKRNYVCCGGDRKTRRLENQLTGNALLFPLQKPAKIEGEKVRASKFARICASHADMEKETALYGERYRNTSWSLMKPDYTCYNCSAVVWRNGAYDFLGSRPCPHGCRKGKCMVRPPTADSNRGTRSFAEFVSVDRLAPCVAHYKVVDRCVIQNKTKYGYPVPIANISALTRELHRCSLHMYANKAPIFFFNIGFGYGTDRCFGEVPQMEHPLCRFELEEEFLLDECAQKGNVCADSCLAKLHRDGVCDTECAAADCNDEDCDAPPTRHWEHCADEGEVCSCFSKIRFSATESSEPFQLLIVGGSAFPTACLASVFGDHAGKVKKCFCEVADSQPTAAYRKPIVDQAAAKISNPHDVRLLVTMGFSANKDKGKNSKLVPDAVGAWKDFMSEYLPSNRVAVKHSPTANDSPDSLAMAIAMQFPNKPDAFKVAELAGVEDFRRYILERWNFPGNNFETPPLVNVDVSVEYGGHVDCGNGFSSFTCSKCPTHDCPTCLEQVCAADCMWAGDQCIERSVSCGNNRRVPSCAQCMPDTLDSGLCSGDCMWETDVCIDRSVDCGRGNTAPSCAACLTGNCEGACMWKKEEGCVDKMVLCGNKQSALTCAECTKCAGDCIQEAGICIERIVDCGMGHSAKSCSHCPAANCEEECIMNKSKECIERKVFCGGAQYANTCAKCVTSSPQDAIAPTQCAGECMLKADVCIERTVDCGRNTVAPSCALCGIKNCEGACRKTKTGLCIEQAMYCGNNRYATTCAQCVPDSVPQGTGVPDCHGECQWKAGECVERACTGSCAKDWEFCSNEGELCDCATIMSYGMPGATPINVTGKAFPTVCKKGSTECYCKKDSAPIPASNPLELRTEVKASFAYKNKSAQLPPPAIVNAVRASLPRFPGNDISVVADDPKLPAQPLERKTELSFQVHTRDKENFTSLLEGDLFKKRVGKAVEQVTPDKGIGLHLMVKNVHEHTPKAQFGPGETIVMHKSMDHESMLGLTMIGCPSQYPDADPQWQLVERRHGVRCCAEGENGTKCESAFLPDDTQRCNVYSCTRDCPACGQYWHTYAEALQRCADMSDATDIAYRLCTRQEVKDNSCCDTGCQFDSNRLWVLPDGIDSRALALSSRRTVRNLTSSGTFVPTLPEYQVNSKCAWPSHFVPWVELENCARDAQAENATVFYFDYSLDEKEACFWSELQANRTSVCTYAFRHEFELDNCRETSKHCAPRCTSRLRGDEVCDSECTNTDGCDDVCDCRESQTLHWHWIFCAQEGEVCECSTTIRFSVSPYSEPHTKTDVHGRDLSTACSASILGDPHPLAKKNCYCREGHTPMKNATLEYFLADGGQNCDTACESRQQTCNRNKIEEAASSEIKCLEILEFLGKTPRRGRKQSDDNSGCSYHPDGTGWYKLLRKQEGLISCSAEHPDLALQRVCSCGSGVPTNTELIIGMKTDANMGGDLVKDTVVKALGSTMNKFPEEQIQIRDFQENPGIHTLDVSSVAQFSLANKRDADHLRHLWKVPSVQEKFTNSLSDLGLSHPIVHSLDTRTLEQEPAADAPYHDDITVLVDMNLVADVDDVINLERDQQWELSLRLNEALRDLLAYHHDGLYLHCSLDGQFALVRVLCTLGIDQITYAEDIVITLNTADFIQAMEGYLHSLKLSLFAVSRVVVTRVTIDSTDPHFVIAGSKRCPTSNLAILGSCAPGHFTGDLCNTTSVAAYCTSIWVRPLCVYCEHNCPQVVPAKILSWNPAACACGQTYGWLDWWRDTVYASDSCSAVFLCKKRNVFCTSDGALGEFCCKEPNLVEISMWVLFDSATNLDMRPRIASAISDALGEEKLEERLHVSATPLSLPNQNSRHLNVRFIVPVMERSNAEALKSRARTYEFSAVMKEKLSHHLGRPTEVIILRDVRVILNEYDHDFSAKMELVSDRKLAPSVDEQLFQKAVSYSIGNYSDIPSFRVKILRISTETPSGGRRLSTSFPSFVQMELKRFLVEDDAITVAESICERPFRETLQGEVGALGIQLTSLQLSHDLDDVPCIDKWIPVLGTLEVRIAYHHPALLLDVQHGISKALESVFRSSPRFFRRIHYILGVYQKSSAQNITVKENYVMHAKTHEHATEILSLIESEDFHARVAQEMQTDTALAVQMLVFTNCRIDNTFDSFLAPDEAPYTISLRFNVRWTGAVSIPDLSDAATFAITQEGVPNENVEIFLFEIEKGTQSLLGIHYTISRMMNIDGPALVDRFFDAEFPQELSKSFKHFLGPFRGEATFLPVDAEASLYHAPLSYFTVCRLCASFLRPISIPDSLVHTLSKFAISSALGGLSLLRFKVFVHRQESFGRTAMSIAIVIVDANTMEEAQKMEDDIRDADLPSSLPRALARWLDIMYSIQIEVVDIAILNQPYTDAAHPCLLEADETDGEAEGQVSVELVTPEGAPDVVADVARKSVAESLNVEEHRVNLTASVSGRRLARGKTISANVKYNVDFRVLMDSAQDTQMVASVMHDKDFVKVLEDAVTHNLPVEYELKEIIDISEAGKQVKSSTVVL